MEREGEREKSLAEERREEGRRKKRKKEGRKKINRYKHIHCLLFDSLWFLKTLIMKTLKKRPLLNYP